MTWRGKSTRDGRKRQVLSDAATTLSLSLQRLFTYPDPVPPALACGEFYLYSGEPHYDEAYQKTKLTAQRACRGCCYIWTSSKTLHSAKGRIFQDVERRFRRHECDWSTSRKLYFYTLRYSRDWYNPLTSTFTSPYQARPGMHVTSIQYGERT